MHIAVIGLGVIGSRMARRWQQAGHEVVGWNRTRATAAKMGLPLAGTPRAAAEAADVIMLVVADPPALHSVVSGPGGVATGALTGRIVLDASTVGPHDNQKAEAAVRAAGGQFMETPFTGSKMGAENGKLVFFAGGEKALLPHVEPLLMQVGQRVFHFGPVGAGSDAKLIFNILLAGLMQSMAEGLALAQSAGLDVQMFLDAYRLNAGWSTLAEMKLANVIKGDFTPHFALKHMDKDVRLALERAAELGTQIPLGERVKELYAQAMAAGLGDEDFSAIYRMATRRTRQAFATT